ncbi:hypothetical protein ZHAS_00006769 [Anopheles sinensis]|uniref:SAM domain-containing protein n=1 Tax=Anopheles sinensis TaxID=74873 RepID=A0A084VMZ7_ANOSI|nr:hypothetical protein ZHAS_00006769 [Anopheles sinensis]
MNTSLQLMYLEDLEDLGIMKMGHQKKILMSIERIKDVTSGRMDTSRLSGVSEWPQPIEYVTITWRSLASVTHPVPPPDGPYHAFTSLRPSPPPRKTYTLLAGPAEEQSDEDAGATALFSAPSIEDMHDPFVIVCILSFMFLSEMIRILKFHSHLLLQLLQPFGRIFGFKQLI